MHASNGATQMLGKQELLNLEMLMPITLTRRP
ncbi:hypothetical protein N7447_006456 [Penicillium robsamsonii]|nr:uncharacterized protein N7447_006456 [Penicillium robsamsonii]KAJ5824116.1 hypothetical protein N7447_006456 [Penicillium robsamsonii]